MSSRAKPRDLRRQICKRPPYRQTTPLPPSTRDIIHLPMPGTNTKLTTAVEQYFTDLRQIRASGGSTPELSYYPPLNNLLNAVGNTLKPKVFCISAMAQQGADHPDFGLYSAPQIQKGKPREGQRPERGVIEVKPSTDDAWLTAEGGQVSKYWGFYRIVLVTNTRDFVLLGEDAKGQPATSVIPDSDRGPTGGLGTGDAHPAKLRGPSGSPTAPSSSTNYYRSPAHSHATPDPASPSTSPAPCPTPPRLPSRGTSPGSSHPTHAMVWHASSLTMMHHHWRALRSALEEALGIQYEGRPWRLILSFHAGADSLLRCLLGVGVVVPPNARRPQASSIGTKQSGTCALRSCKRTISATLRPRAVWNPWTSSRCSTGRPLPWTASTATHSSTASTRGRPSRTSTSPSSKPSTPTSASSLASGTRPPRWSATWSLA